MAIIVENRFFHLTGKDISYVICALEDGRLCHVHYGNKLQQQDISIELLRTGSTGYSIDGIYSASVLTPEYSTFGVGDFREPCLAARNTLGQNCVDLRFSGWEVVDGKPMPQRLPATFGSEQECQTLILTCADTVLGLEAKLYYTVFHDHNVIARRVEFTNTGGENITLERALSACLELPDGNYDMVSFDGAWARERTISRSILRPGTQSICSRSGFSSHTHNPLLVVCDRDAGEENGRWYAMNLVYSGGFYASAELSAQNTVRMVMGIDPVTCRFTLVPGERLLIPEVVLAYSGAGATALTHDFHDLYRKHLVRQRPRPERPVLLNNWEATYFDFNQKKLEEIACEAQKLGIDLFVLDDGWFGKRNSDTSGLGDWFVNREKLPDGMSGLGRFVEDLGMELGLWLEPESISEDSDFYRAHPDWCVHIPGRNRTRSRNQLLADITRPEVRRAIMDQICEVLSNAPVRYVKWDMNRPMTEPGGLSEARQDRFGYDFILGLYEMLEEFHKRFPHILLEGCSAGGARFDPGMLYYCPQIWASDNTDAYARLKIQQGTSFAYPIRAIGSHVSAVPNHQTNRITPLETRFAVALAGTFGYELDPTVLTDEERREISQQIRRFRKLDKVLSDGDYYRLQTTESGDFAFGTVSKDKREAVYVYMQCLRVANTLPKRIRLRGVDDARFYRDQATDKVFSGNLLRHIGYPLDVLNHDWQAVVIHLKAEDDRER